MTDLGKRAADFIRTVDPFGDHFSEYDLRVLSGEPTGSLPEYMFSAEDEKEEGQQWD